MDIGALDDLRILPFCATQTGYKKGESVRFLAYLFDFLECFDFGKNQDSTPSDKLIKSSVLGAMFEKLNGYQEGSFYTPNFITAYMCRESLSKIIVEKFNATFGWGANNLESLRKQIDRDFGEKEAEFRRVLESIRICDPSVGSGHFLVSALNEMIAIYHKLGLLGFGYKDLQIKDDEIHLITKEGERFAYKRLQDSNHQIQIALFNLKKTIIENNLFGVDINPNSCNIARLRLWIELLKNAYYLNFTKDEDSKIHKLQTLPNIDINIKCGNSLISNINTNITLKNFTQNLQERQKNTGDLFINASLESQIKDTQRKAQIKFQEMRKNVESYKNENDKQASRIYKQKYGESYQYLCELFKRNCDEYINFYQELEYFFQQYGYINLRNLEEQTRFHIESYAESFDFHKSVDFERKISREIPPKELENLLSLMRIYEDFNQQATFEWRFAFPEVLDSNGDFLGFDLVIGNPPYIRQEEIKHLKPQLQKAFEVYKGTSDIYTYFYELGLKILKNNGILSFITSNKWCRAAYGEPLRRFLLENTTIHTYLDLNGIKVFESATVDTSILELHKAKANESHSLNYANPKDYNPKDEKPLSPQYSKIAQNSLSTESFIFSDSKLAALKAKIESIGTPLKDWGININYGIKTGYNEAFIINTAKREEILSACRDENERARTEELIKPILRGRDIKRYSYEWAGLWIILAKFDSHKYLEKDYPAIYNHLLQYKDKLQARGQCRYARGNKADTGKGYSGQHHWLELDNNPKDSYLREFAKPKIVYSEIVREPQFYLDNGEFKFGHFYAEATSFILSGNANFKNSLEYLLGILRSKLCTFAFKEFYAGGGLGESGYRYKKAFLEKLPIPKITKKQENEFVELVREIVQVKQNGGATEGAQNEQTKALESRLDSMVYALYGLDSKEIEIIGGGGQ